MAAALSILTFILLFGARNQEECKVSEVRVSPREKRQTQSFISRPLSMVRSSLELLSDVTNYFIQDEDRNQCRMEPRQPFPCKLRKPSSNPPTSVHKLRPADIAVVAALGDSITAGGGARANSVLDIFKEYRGVSFSVGGDKTWREYITLPNILELFNPNLYGQSYGITRVGSRETSGYNFAVSGATSAELAGQAWRLVQAMRKDPWIDFYTDWKMVTIIIGHNDACTHICNSTLGVDMFEDASPATYARNIQAALDILQRNLPRTFVNLVPIADVTMILDLMDKPVYCYPLHWYLCPCLFDPKFSMKLSKPQMKKVLSSYMNELSSLISTARYETTTDFTVVIQPSLVNGLLPRHFNELYSRRLPDLSYLAPDCFHFSQKLHALVGRSLWNNLLQPVGSKTTNWEKEVPFLCPTKTSPFFATSQNSAYKRRTRTSSLARDWWSLLTVGHTQFSCTL
jgi:phospholipase B1